MGSLTSRQNIRNEESDSSANQIYRYSPKSGNYFANYFILGGDRFDTPQPETFLFGDNMDLNFLGTRPITFPYPLAQPGEPLRPLKCSLNIRRESLRFVRASNQDKNAYNIEFFFDTDVKCSIRIYYFCTEEVTSTGITYNSKDEKLTSDMYFYKRGSNQQFVQPAHTFDPSLYSDEELSYNIEKDTIPVVIQCIALEGLDDVPQSHTTIAVIERHSDGSYTLKALKQKIFDDGVYYLLQEIYGIENKMNETNKESNDDEIDDGGLECVICMSDMRDTLILPCRHLCLCQACADSLRYQANNCPICRSPFRALLQIKALQKYTDQTISTSEPTDGTPIGFERVPLIEALNGPAYAKRYPNTASVELVSDSSDVVPVIYSSFIRNKRNERLAKALRVKTSFSSKDSFDEDNETTKDTSSPIHLGKLASHDTEDEDKSSSITDHLLHDKSVVYSPDTAHHVNEISNTEDEMPDEDSDVEKLSPLLEIVTTFENDVPSRIEISVSDPAANENGSSRSKEFEERVNGNSKFNTKETDKCIRSNSCGSSSDERKPNLKCSNEDFSSSSSDGPAKSPLSSLHADKDPISQPGTPASVASIRSSDDSYSSSGSSRRLLSSHEKPTPV